MSAVKKNIKIKVKDEDKDTPKKSKKSAGVKKTTTKKKPGAKKASAKSPKRTTSKKQTKNKEPDIIKINDRKKPVQKIMVEDSDVQGTKADSAPRTEMDREEKAGRQSLLRQGSGAQAAARENEDNLLSGRGDAVKDLVASTMAAEDEDKEGKSGIDNPPELNNRRSIGLYRKIAYGFIFFTLILLAAIFYFAFTKVTITLIPNQERINNNMIIDIVDADSKDPAPAGTVKGVVKLINIEDEKGYSAEGKEVIGEETIGRVTIINNYNKNQPLVATTRILSPDNKLFRLKDTVNVPAGSSVEVDVYADEPGEDMAIEATKFTIPGLWAGLQDKIYAESESAMVYQKKVKRHIEKDDIDNGIRDLKQALLDKARSEINENYKQYSQIIYKIKEDSIKSEVDGEVGDEVDEFKISMTADVVVVAFNEKETAALAKQKFLSALPGNKELVSFDENKIIYALNNFDENEMKATISATFEGKVSLKEGAQIIETDKILGLNKDQLDAYLGSLPEIAGYEVRFFPSFIKKVPRLVDRIEIIIKK